MRKCQECFLSNVRKTDSCWLWTLPPDSHGYGPLRWGEWHGDAAKKRNNKTYAHRVSYEMFVGPIPSGMTIDHLCRVKLCVNPAHLEPVTVSENVRRMHKRKPTTSTI